jgi:hypothetical protein
VSKHSSTSSSDATGSEERAFGSGIPWAFFLSLLLLAMVEIGFRVSDPVSRIPIQSGLDRGRAVIQTIESGGATDICFVGSSRTLEGIMVPEVQARLRSSLGYEYTMANFANPGFRAVETATVVSKLLEHGSPVILLYGFTCHQVNHDDNHLEMFSFFWRLDEWFGEFRERGMEVVRYLPIVVRRHIGDIWLSVKYRHLVTALLRNLRYAYGNENIPLDPWAIVRRETFPNPLRGELATPHKYFPNAKLSERGISDAHVEEFAARAVVDGRFNFTRFQIDKVVRIARLCREHEVELVFFEIPLSKILRRHLPANTVERTREIFVDVAREEGVVIYTLDDYGIEWTDDLFREQSHLGNDGALKLSTWLADHAIVPLLRDGEDSAADGG